MLVGNGVICVAMTQLIFERAATILYHMHYFFFSKNYAKISRIAKNELFMSFSPQQR